MVEQKALAMKKEISEGEKKLTADMEWVKGELKKDMGDMRRILEINKD